MWRRQQPYYGSLVPLKARAAALFLLFVVTWGYAQDHHVHDLQGFAVAVLRDLASAVQQVGNAATPHRGSSRRPGASATAKADIPRNYLSLYRASAGTCPHMTWGLLAGVGKVETDHGRSNTTSPAGAEGPMQFMPGTWAVYGQGGNVWSPQAAIPAAARKLCADGVRAGRVRQALYAYNCGRPYCAVSTGYVNRVLRYASSYQGSR